MKRIFYRIALWSFIVLALVYIGDDLSLRFGFPRSRARFGQISVQHYDAVKLKNGRTEFYFDQPETETCVRSPFPHLGYAPCWYIARNSVSRTDFNSGTRTIFPQ